jgi:UDP-glucose 4-epimerase
MAKPTILVTGGAGYIGSHVVLALSQAGYPVVVLDNLDYGHKELIASIPNVELIIGDTIDRPLLDILFNNHQIGAVMHFSAYAYVGESVTAPAKYYRNNVVGTLSLLEAMVAAGVDKFVFSSTCATYGNPQAIPITEDHPQAPINPYGATKLMVERILQDFEIYGLNSVCFRYFNAAGANPEGLLGEDHTPETHLIPLTLFAAMGKIPAISVFGTDYDTPDGTCIRDYIHVNDLASAHILGLEYLLAGGKSDRFNLGNGNGFSVRQVIDTARQVTGKEIKVIEGDRRPGDPAVLVGSGAKAKKVLNWNPQFADLSKIITDAWHWHQQRHG